MNEREEESVLLFTEPEATAAWLAQACADGVTIACDLRDKIRAGIDTEIEDIGADIGRCYGRIIDGIERELEGACACETSMQDRMRYWIDNELDGAAFCQNSCQAKIDRYQALLNKKANKAKMREADAEREQQNRTFALSDDAGFVPDSSASPAPAGGASSCPDPSYFGPPPGPSEFADLVLLLAAQQGTIALTELPAPLWQPLNENGVWLSMDLTPFSRASIATFCPPPLLQCNSGPIYFNVVHEWDVQTIIATLGQLGLEMSSVDAFSAQNAWERVVAAYGEPAILTFWDCFNLPHPWASPTSVPRKPDRIPPNGPGPTSCVDPSGNVVAPEPDSLDAEIAQARAQLCSTPAPCVNQNSESFTSVTDLIPGLRLPTLAELCNLLAPLWTWRGVDIRRFPPCATYAEWKAYLQELAGEER